METKRLATYQGWKICGAMLITKGAEVLPITRVCPSEILLFTFYCDNIWKRSLTRSLIKLQAHNYDTERNAYLNRTQCSRATNRCVSRYLQLVPKLAARLHTSAVSFREKVVINPSRPKRGWLFLLFFFFCYLLRGSENHFSEILVWTERWVSSNRSVEMAA